MEIQDFKNKLDSRDFWGVNSKEVFDVAHKWAEECNNASTNNCNWSWDCGLKLDYDGDICRISSRFYPPHKVSAEYGLYSGTLSVYVFDTKVFDKKFEEKTLDILKTTVEYYVSGLESKLKTNLIAMFKEV